MENKLRIKIGEVIIAAYGVDDCPCLQPEAAYHQFQVANGQPDVSLQVHYGQVPEVDFQDRVFECQGPWSLYRMEGKLLLAMPSPVLGGPVLHLAILDPDFASGNIYISLSETPLVSDSSGAALAVDPFLNPLDEVLLINFLAQRRLGLVIHAFGLSDQGHGLVFCGVSGAGKSTMSSFWRKTGVTLLSDDRIIVRPQDDAVWIYGTPWHGDAKISSPQRAPLEKLYFISHSSENKVAPLTNAEAASRLLVRCFPPFYDRQGMVNTLEIIAQIIDAIPCYELGFAPDESIVDFIREQNEAG